MPSRHVFARKITMWKSIVGVLALAGVLGAGRCGRAGRATTPSGAVVEALQREGLDASVAEIAWIDHPSPWRTARGVVRAWKAGDPADIYLFRGRVAENGALLDELDLYNLTNTDSADEGAPLVSGTHVAFEVRQAGLTTGIRCLNADREASIEGNWPATARVQNALANWQQTGQFVGVGNVFWAVEPPAKISIGFAGDVLEIHFDDEVARVPLDGGEPTGGSRRLRWRRAPKAHPGNLLTWAVDRARAITWFGDERMQLIKAVVFSGLDVLRRAQARVLGDSVAEEIAADLDGISEHGVPVTYTDPETGWPPAPIKAVMGKPLEGEGQWIALDNDPFVPMNPGAPPAFLTTFLRADCERGYTRIYVTLWDPRQVELHMMAGAIEPRGPTGEAGPGLIPRTPEIMRRLAGALNGGFQAMHGEFGLMADSVEYLPPKPYAATIAELRDGSTGFGTWPRETNIPLDMLSFRQNLTVLVQTGKINPYGRTWWGGTPPDWVDRVHSTRTGLCLTEEGFIAYFYGNEIDWMPLARTMVQARCRYGIHLDMNPGHTGLEFYRAAPTGSLPPLGRPVQKDWEAEGTIEGMEGWSFRARRMVRFMGLMNFPRYIQREARDYFYLTLRSVLPGHDLAPGANPPEPDEGKWRTRGLPQHGYPFAIATTRIRPEPSRPDLHAFLLKIDPRVARPEVPSGLLGKAPILASLSNADVVARQPTLWIEGSGVASIGGSASTPDAIAVVSGMSTEAPEASDAVAAIGVEDETGMVVLAELREDHGPGRLGSTLRGVMKQLGCSSFMLLRKPLMPVLGDEPPPRDARGSTFGRVLRMVRVQAPGARQIFGDTPVVNAKEWVPLQAKRVRYFRHAQAASPRASAAPSADAPPMPGASEP